MEHSNKNLLADYQNGRPGAEFSLDRVQNKKLDKLNNFYEEYVKEQGKRVKPFTRADYIFFDTISNLPKNSRDPKTGKYFLDARKGHVIY